MVTDQVLASDVLLAACDGDAAIYDRIRIALGQAIPRELATARAQLERGSLAALRETAHKLNGMIGTASTTVAEIASELEDRAELGERSAAEQRLVQLESMVPTLLAQLAATSFEALTRSS